MQSSVAHKRPRETWFKSTDKQLQILLVGHLGRRAEHCSASLRLNGLRYELHDSNYQTKTWRKTDFYTQLEEIQRSIISYAGVKGAAAESLVQQRLTSLLSMSFEKPIGGEIKYIFVNMHNYWVSQTKRTVGRIFEIYWRP